MWCVTSPLLVLLLVALSAAEPEPGYDYLPPTIPFRECRQTTSTLYVTSTQRSVVPTYIPRKSTQYRTEYETVVQVVPTTRYSTHIETRVDYQVSTVRRQSQVFREQVITSTNRGPAVYNTRYETTYRVVPQVSYVTRIQTQTNFVPVEVINTRYTTRYQDQVRYQTVPVVRTSILTIPEPGRVSTIYDQRIQSSIVRRPQPDQTKYQHTTIFQDQIRSVSVPSPPVYRTSYVQSQVTIPSYEVNTQYQTNYVTRTQYVTKTSYETQTRYTTRYVPQEVLITVNVPQEVIRTQYRDQHVPTTKYQTEYSTVVIPGPAIQRTNREYRTSTVYVPGADRVVTREVVTTIDRQSISYVTKVDQRVSTKIQVVPIPCSGYNYDEPSIKFNF